MTVKLSEENLKKLSTRTEKMEFLLESAKHRIDAQEDASHLLSAVSQLLTVESRPGTGQSNARPATGQDSIAGSLQQRIAAEREAANARPGTAASQSLSQRPGTGASQRPGTGASQRPGTGVSQRPGTGASERPMTGMSQRPGSGASRASSRPSTTTLLALGHGGQESNVEAGAPLSMIPLTEVTNGILDADGDKALPRPSSGMADLQRNKAKGRRVAGNARAAQSSIGSALSWE